MKYWKLHNTKWLINNSYNTPTLKITTIKIIKKLIELNK